MSEKHGETTQRVQTLRDTLKLPATELEEVIARHAEASEASCAASDEVKREARKVSITPHRLPKP